MVMATVTAKLAMATKVVMPLQSRATSLANVLISSLIDSILNPVIILIEARREEVRASRSSTRTTVPMAAAVSALDKSVAEATPDMEAMVVMVAQLVVASEIADQDVQPALMFQPSEVVMVVALATLPAAEGLISTAMMLASQEAKAASLVSAMVQEMLVVALIKIGHMMLTTATTFAIRIMVISTHWLTSTRTLRSITTSLVTTVARPASTRIAPRTTIHLRIRETRVATEDMVAMAMADVAQVNSVAKITSMATAMAMMALATLTSLSFKLRLRMALKRLKITASSSTAVSLRPVVSLR
jgi:hypothetical protein